MAPGEEAQKGIEQGVQSVDALEKLRSEIADVNKQLEGDLEETRKVELKARLDDLTNKLQEAQANLNAGIAGNLEGGEDTYRHRLKDFKIEEADSLDAILKLGAVKFAKIWVQYKENPSRSSFDIDLPDNTDPSKFQRDLLAILRKLEEKAKESETDLSTLTNTDDTLSDVILRLYEPDQEVEQAPADARPVPENAEPAAEAPANPTEAPANPTEAQAEAPKEEKKEKKGMFDEFIAMIVKALASMNINLPFFNNMMNKYATTEGVRTSLLDAQAKRGTKLTQAQVDAYAKKLEAGLSSAPGNQKNAFSFVSLTTGIPMGDIDDLVTAGRSTLETQIDGKKADVPVFAEFDALPPKLEVGDMIVYHTEAGKYVPVVVLDAGPPPKAAYQNKFMQAFEFNPEGTLPKDLTGAKIYVAYKVLRTDEARISQYKEVEAKKAKEKAAKKEEKKKKEEENKAVT